jgi:O-antigen/teichoic acid export membrane protein
LSLVRASLALTVGHGLAHLLPLLFGPWLSRLYTPAQFAEYSLVWAVATSLAVVACARYEMALPLAGGAASLRALLALSLRLLAVLWGLAALVGALLMARWPSMALLPALVLLMGAFQLLSMLATRQERFAVLMAAKIGVWNGLAALQVVAGLLLWGVWGMALAAVVSLTLGVLALAWPLRAQLRGLRAVSWSRLQAVARRHKDFPLLNTPHAFAGAAQDALTLLLLTAWTGDAATGLWALALRYLKAPASLVGSAVSTVLYPRLTGASSFEEGRRQLRRAMRLLVAMALPFALVLLVAGPDLFAWVFGEPWRGSGELARALAPYLAFHFVASPLAVVTMAWGAQAWALKLALVGQVLFLLALVLGLHWGGLIGAGWAVSVVMMGYFGYYFWALWNWRAV